MGYATVIVSVPVPMMKKEIIVNGGRGAKVMPSMTSGRTSMMANRIQDCQARNLILGHRQVIHHKVSNRQAIQRQEGPRHQGLHDIVVAPPSPT